MRNCEQTKGLSVLAHGISVKNYLFDLINHLKSGEPLKYEWKLPEWVYDNKNILLSSLPSNKILQRYTILHDCGKPFCREIGDDNKTHFKNHADVSYQTFKKIYDDPIAAFLIKHDMDIHLLKSNDVLKFSKNPYAIVLLLTGLAEIHSNAQMFGGFDSVSFKIKWKSINKRGKQIITNIKNNN